MDKPISELIADLKNICTNDPAMQSRIVKVFEAMLESLGSKKDRPISGDKVPGQHFIGCGCCTGRE